jgi:uncharacterized protein YlxW (UPF0749 family)
MEMSKIVEAIEDIINGHLSGMDFSDMITTEVRECWDMDDLDRIDDMDDRLETVESWITDAEDKFSIQNVIDLESSVKNLVEHTNQLQMRIKDLEDRLNDYEEIREMAWQSANKSFFQKLMFWRGSDEV